MEPRPVLTCPTHLSLEDKTMEQAAPQSIPVDPAPSIPRRHADLMVHGGCADTVYLLRPVSPAGSEWIAQHIPADAVRLGDGVAVEHRYIVDIISGAVADGLSVGRGV